VVAVHRFYPLLCLCICLWVGRVGWAIGLGWSRGLGALAAASSRQLAVRSQNLQSSGIAFVPVGFGFFFGQVRPEPQNRPVVGRMAVEQVLDVSKMDPALAVLGHDATRGQGGTVERWGGSREDREDDRCQQWFLPRGQQDVGTVSRKAA
jgi:hypothetical protein